MDNKYILFSAAAILSAIPPVVIKQYNNKKFTNPKSKYIYLLISIISSVLLIYVYIKIFEKNDIGPYYALIKILSILLVSASGFLFYGDLITGKQAIGMVLGIVTIMLLASK